MVYTYNEILLTPKKGKKGLSHTKTLIKFKDVMLSEKAVTKGGILYDSTFMKYLT